MKIKKVIILSLAEAKEIMAGWYAEVVRRDPKEFAQSILAGLEKAPIQHNFLFLNNWTTHQICLNFGELNLGEPFAMASLIRGEPVDQILIQDGEKYDIAWDIENVDPEHRPDLVVEFIKNLETWSYIEEIGNEEFFNAVKSYDFANNYFYDEHNKKNGKDGATTAEIIAWCRANDQKGILNAVERMRLKKLKTKSVSTPEGTTHLPRYKLSVAEMLATARKKL